MQNHNVDYVENVYICSDFRQNSINFNFCIMEKRVFKSVSQIECIGTFWHGVLIRASLNELIKVFGLKMSCVNFNSIYDKTRYQLCIKTKALPAFSIYDRCIFDFGRRYDNENDVVIDWHLGTFNDYVDIRTCFLLKTLGLTVISYFNVDIEDDLPF